MAISKTLSYRGLSIQDSYVNIDHVFVTKNMMGIQFNVFASDEVRLDGGAPIYSSRIDLAYDGDLVGTNPFTQAYNLMKDTEDFAGAVDC